MDEQLKQRLLGASIIVALVVIFVPMLFEDVGHPADPATVELPALPDAIEEHNIELPKTAADVAAEEQAAKDKENKGKAGKRGAAPESGYRIIPLDDPPPKPAKKAEPPAPVVEAAPAAEPLAEGEESPVEDEEAPVEGEDAPEEAADEVVPPKPGKAPNKTNIQADAGASKSKPGAAPVTDHGHAAPVVRPLVAPLAPAIKPKPAPVAPKPEKPSVAEAAAPKAIPKPMPARPIEPLVLKGAPTKHVQAQIDLPEPVPVPVPIKSQPLKPVVPKPPLEAPPKPVATTPKPVAPAPKPPESKHAAGASSAWLVQAGSFAGESNARGLAERLRKQGVPAFVDVISGSAGSVYRVRVGPELNRGRAEHIQKQIENAVGIKGIILPHH